MHVGVHGRNLVAGTPGHKRTSAQAGRITFCSVLLTTSAGGSQEVGLLLLGGCLGRRGHVKESPRAHQVDKVEVRESTRPSLRALRSSREPGGILWRQGAPRMRPPPGACSGTSRCCPRSSTPPAAGGTGSARPPWQILRPGRPAAAPVWQDKRKQRMAQSALNSTSRIRARHEHQSCNAHSMGGKRAAVYASTWSPLTVSTGLMTLRRVQRT